MNLVQNVTTPQFKGMLVITSKDRMGGDTAIAINTKQITTMTNEKYRDIMEDDDDDAKFVNGTYMTLNNGCSVRVFAPVERIIDAYAHAKEEGIYEMETKYPAILQKPLFG